MTGRALVTGGAGFIGSTLVDRLLDQDWEVLAVDSFEPFYPRIHKETNLERARRSAHFELAEVDTRDVVSLRRAALSFRPDAIFDFAARAGVRPSLADPALYIDINVRGLQHTLSVAAEVGAKVIFASSSSIYGNDERTPFQEDQARGQPESPYGATKVGAEALVHAHHASTSLPVAIARLFTVYGPRQRPDLAIHRFAQQMLDREPIELYDGGAGVRDYTYVDDVVDAFLGMGEGQHEYLLVNIGSHRPLTTRQVVHELERALDVKAETIDRPRQPGDVNMTYADISRASHELGWIPRTPFREGIERFCEWLVNQRRIASGD